MFYTIFAADIIALNLRRCYNLSQVMMRKAIWNMEDI